MIKNFRFFYFLKQNLYFENSEEKIAPEEDNKQEDNKQEDNNKQEKENNTQEKEKKYKRNLGIRK